MPIGQAQRLANRLPVDAGTQHKLINFGHIAILSVKALLLVCRHSSQRRILAQRLPYISQRLMPDLTGRKKP
jgi:hypothetical protein